MGCTGNQIKDIQEILKKLENLALAHKNQLSKLASRMTDQERKVCNIEEKLRSPNSIWPW